MTSSPLVLAALAAFTAPAFAKPCPMMIRAPHPLAPTTTDIPDGGGIVVAAEAEQDDDKAAQRGAVTDWQFAGKPAKITHVAPGLDVVAVPAAGTLTSKDGASQLAVKHAAKAPAVLAAPAVTSIERAAPGNREVRHPYVQLRATLSADPPATAVAIVVFDKTGKTGRSWGEIEGAERSLVLYHRGGCTPPPDGSVDSGVDEEVTLAYLDSTGRLSKLSAPIKITAAAK